MGQDQRAQGVELAEVPHLEEERDGERLHGHHLGDQEHDEQGGPESEAESGDRRRREKRDQRGDDHHRAGDDKAVDEVATEFLLPEDPPEGIKSRREGPGPRLGRLDLTRRLERAQHHPVKRERHHDRDDQG